MHEWTALTNSNSYLFMEQLLCARASTRHVTGTGSLNPHGPSVEVVAWQSLRPQPLHSGWWRTQFWDTSPSPPSESGALLLEKQFWALVRSHKGPWGSLITTPSFYRQRETDPGSLAQGHGGSLREWPVMATKLPSNADSATV